MQARGASPLNLFDVTFTDAQSADAYFTGNVLDFGDVSGLGSLELDFELDFKTHTVGSGFSASLEFGSPAPVPLPDSLGLLLAGLLGLAGVGLRRVSVRHA